MTDDDGAGRIGVNTSPHPDGSYGVALELGPDDALELDDRAALKHPRAVLRAVAEAEHDAAVMRQLTSLGVDPAHAAGFLAELRGERDRPAWPTPLELEPGVSVYTGRPFLGIRVRGDLVGQWTVDDARGHALHVLEARVVAELDEAYRRLLTTTIGLDDERARAAVAGLGDHR